MVSFWIFLFFHLCSLLFCLLATRLTLRYLAKHHVNPQQRYLLFGFLRLRYAALLYMVSIFTLTAYVFVMSLYHLLKP